MISAFKRNLGWIFTGNIIHAVLQFALNVYCARQFGADDFGILNYSVSLIAFFSAIGTLGFNGVITKFFAEDESNTGRYLFTCIVSRIFFAIVSIIFLQVIIRFDKDYTSLLGVIVLCQSLQILFESLDLFVYWFRYKNQAKEVAIIRLLSFALSAVWRFVAIYYHSLIWYTIGVSIETGVFMLLLFLLYKKEFGACQFQFDRGRLRTVLTISYPFIFSAVLSTIYSQTDKIMLKSMVDFSSVGIYSVSLTLAGAIVILPVALIEGFRPEIMIHKVNNEEQYKRRLKQLYGIIFWICIAYCLFITFFSKTIVSLIYGPAYLGAVSSLSVIVWYTSFSYFGAVNNLYLVAEGQTKWVQIITLAGAILNLLLNYILIPKWGIVGAAWASLFTQVFANYILLWVIVPLRPCFYLLNSGIALRWLQLPKRMK